MSEVVLSEDENTLLRHEISEVQTILGEALEVTDPVELLAAIATTVDTLTATQHELVNVLLDRGLSWSSLADALSTSSASAKRRFPRRESRSS